MKKVLISLLFAVLINIANAQDKKLTAGLEYRPRAIVNSGYRSPKLSEDKAVISVSQRTRVNIGFTRDKLKTYISIQDVRFWGDDTRYSKLSSLGNSHSLSVNQAWFSLDLSPTVTLKAGRQLFKYDDERIISSRNWVDYQQTYDAALLSINKGKCKLNIALSWNAEDSNYNFYPVEKFKIFDFVRYETQLNNLNISAIALLTGNNVSFASDEIFLRGTYGVNGIYSNKGLKLKGSVYYQNNLNDKMNDVSAYCFSVLAQHKLCNNKATLGVGIDYLSGQDAITEGYTGKMKNFDILYGKRHGGYGYMDYFNQTPLQGLTDIMLKAEYKFSEKALLQADFHWFALNANRFDQNDSSMKLDKNLGQELDLTFKWKVMKDVALQAGYSMYFMTKSLKQVKNVYNKKTDLPVFGYVMISVSPKIFKQSFK